MPQEIYVVKKPKTFHLLALTAVDIGEHIGFVSHSFMCTGNAKEGLRNYV